MIRAGIFIGVDQTGNLQKLHDAASGASRMRDWALSQGFTEARAILMTDAGGQKVRADDIYQAVTTLLDGAGVDQLIVYFAGHGVTINRRERWLLTDAPRNPSAAVNVTGSAEAARWCGVRHVIFISDACRVPPEGIQAQNVQGIEIFPNEGTSDRSRPVDQFFACLVGSTAAEIKDPAAAAGAAAGGFSALYTDALLDGLKGLHAEILEGPTEENDSALYVKPAKLEQYLEREIPERVLRRNLTGRVNQNPDAILTVHPYWLARIDKVPAPLRRIRSTRSARVTPPVPTARTLIDEMVQAVIARGHDLSGELARMKASRLPDVEAVVQTAEEVATPFGPGHLESECGIKVRGATVAGAYCARAGCRIGGRGDLVWVDLHPERAASVLITFDDKTGALVPAIKDFIAALTFEAGELVDLSYEVSQNTARWRAFSEYPQRMGEVRGLRAVIAAASRHGRFRLDDEGAMAIARRMQLSKGVDPTLAVSAAYAFHDLQANERIREMSKYLQEDLGIALFDVELLARHLIDRQLGPGDGVVPFLPLCGQGWALLGAHRVRLPDRLRGIQTTVRDSLWSLYDERGCELLMQAIEAREVL